MTGEMRVAAVAIAAGLAYALSPVAAWFVPAMVWLFWRAQRGLDGRERVWVLGLLGTALAVRLVAIAALIFTIEPGTYTYPSFFGDGRYAIGRSLWMRAAAFGEPLHPRFFFEAFEPYGAGGYNYLLATLQAALGPATWSLHLVAIGFFLAAAVVWHRLARRTFGPAPALLAFALILFAPTWLAWSVSPIKESFQFLVLGLSVTSAIDALERERGRQRAVAAVLCVAGLSVLATLRAGGLVIIIGSLLAGAACAAIRRRRGVAVPVILGVLVIAALAAALPSVRERLMFETNEAANRHLGHVRTPGTFYKLLDERFYHEQPGVIVSVVLTPAEAARFLVRSAVAFVLVPLPWQVQGAAAVLLLPAQMFWYVLLVLAAAGTATAIRLSPVFTAVILGYVALSIVVIAPNSGNVGTLMRHRDMMLPFVMSLSAVGACVWSVRFAPGRMPLVEASARC